MTFGRLPLLFALVAMILVCYFGTITGSGVRQSRGIHIHKNAKGQKIGEIYDGTPDGLVYTHRPGHKTKVKFDPKKSPFDPLHQFRQRKGKHIHGHGRGYHLGRGRGYHNLGRRIQR